ncbi:Hypothetical predicted protein [Octopus vulgaris]|uniref:Uncharacterized protein n=1 Tax=Octopus vulgaris TaxID=6645 RepID=A0AA36FAW6_OCTVU|nr:Hypothetical predicted protein [Octopus vulgaris]
MEACAVTYHRRKSKNSLLAIVDIEKNKKKKTLRFKSIPGESEKEKDIVLITTGEARMKHPAIPFSGNLSMDIPGIGRSRNEHIEHLAEDIGY